MKTVLRVTNLAVRAALLVIVAFITFKHPWPGAWKGAVAVAAVTAATVQLVLWARADLAAPARLRYAFLLPYALAAVTVTCDMAAAGPIGGELMVLAVLAALMAGSDTSLAAGLIVVGAGILACEVMGLFFGATVTTTLEHPAILLIAWMVGYNLRARQAQVEQSAALLAKADQLREEQAKVAALDERARIAREIHDVLAHSLGALGLHIQPPRPSSPGSMTRHRRRSCWARLAGWPSKGSTRPAGPCTPCAARPGRSRTGWPSSARTTSAVTAPG